MCPFCLATMGLIVAGATSAGGLTALGLKLSRKKNNRKQMISDSNERRNQNERSNQDVNSNSR